MPCLEHNYEMCGDRNRMSVYKITTRKLQKFKLSNVHELILSIV